jgi:DNA-binding response OmpR family regulator
MTTQVLCIEDDKDIALAIRSVLRRAGFDVVSATDGRDGLRAFHAKRPDVVLLDIGLPTMDGWTVLERIRDLSDVPVIMLTAHGMETDKVRGLHAGADDYLTKPFGNAELVARVQALLRRSRSARPEAEVYADAIIQLNFGSREVLVGDEPAALTPSEFRLLAALVRHAGQTLSADQLLEQAWNDPLRVGPERVKFAIMRLRRKLGQGESTGPPIEAVRGFGYRYVAPPDGRRARGSGHFPPVPAGGTRADMVKKSRDHHDAK